MRLALRLAGLLWLAAGVAHAGPGDAGAVEAAPPPRRDANAVEAAPPPLRDANAVEAAPPPLRDAGAQGVPVGLRLAEIQRRVQAALHYPESARARGVSGEARLGFEVGLDGRASNVALLASSGSHSLDRAAQRAVHDAGPLPPVLGRVAIPVRFVLVDGESD